jgi:hypothetical protein
MEGKPRLLNPQTRPGDHECETPVVVKFAEVVRKVTSSVMRREAIQHSACGTSCNGTGVMLANVARC